MRGWRGFLAGGLALIALQTVVANRGAAERVGGLAELIGEAARRLLDPSVPAFGAKPYPTAVERPAVPQPAAAYPSPTAPPPLGQPVPEPHARTGPT